MKTTLTPPQNCPRCYNVLNASSSLDKDITPDPGDLTICAYCGTVLEFDENLHFFVFEDVDSLDAKTKAYVAHIQQAIKDRV